MLLPAKTCFGKGSSLINYWVQSSAADFACLAFYDLIKQNNEILNISAVFTAFFF